MPYIDAASGLDVDVERDGLLLVIEHGEERDLGLRVAVLVDEVLEDLLGMGDSLPGVDIAVLDRDKLLHLGEMLGELAVEAYPLDGVNIALVDVDGDVDALLVWGEREIRGLDLEPRVAAVLVEVGEGLEVLVEHAPVVVP